MVNDQNGWEAVVDDDLERQVAGIGALAEPARRALYAFVASAAGPGQPRAGRRAHRAGAALGEVPPGPAGGGGPARRGVPAAERTVRPGCRAAGQAVPALGPAAVGVHPGPPLRPGGGRAGRGGGPVRPRGRPRSRTRSGRPRSRTDDVWARPVRPPWPTPARSEQERVAQVLAGSGYEPRVVGEEVVLANCPFDRLARDHTELVCGLNLALVDGVLQGLGCTTLQAVLDPRPGRCCVTTRVAGPTTA